MKTVKIKTAEALYPLLSVFHDVNGLILRWVRLEKSEDSLVSIIFDFDSKFLIIRANEEDDTVTISSTDLSFSERQANAVNHVYPWKDLIGQKFGWGWVTVNQQGYLDGIMLSFAGIIPQILVTVVASSLKISHIGVPIQIL